MDRLVSYAQNREDMILHVLLNKVQKGFYCDVGAYHPSKFSVTKFFYDRGWSGINIEPNKKLYQLFVDERPRDLNLNIGVSSKRGRLKFRDFTDADGLSTFSKASEFRHETLRNQEYVVKVETLKQVFDENKVKVIDFLKVDVEGFEGEVLAGNDWSKYRPTVVVVEVSPSAWEATLKSNDYVEVFFDGLNKYFVDEAKASQCSIFDYASVLLSYGYLTANEAWLESEVERLKDKYENSKNSGNSVRGDRQFNSGLKGVLRGILVSQKKRRLD